MLIASRTLSLRHDNGDVAIPIQIYAPEQNGAQWICRFGIAWPEGHGERWGAGGDAVQAIFHALTMIGAELYASRQHQAGELGWLEPNQGYGFPVPANIRDLLIGDDKRYL